MESQMHRPTAQEQPQHVASDTEMVEGQAEQGAEKKSVLKKVKDKAKKIKNTIKKHGLGQVDAADDVKPTNPLAHGGPAAVDREEPHVITGTNLPMQTEFDQEKPTEYRYDRSEDVKGQEYTSLKEEGVASPPPPPRAMETEFERPKPGAYEPLIKNMNQPDVAEAREVNLPQPAVEPSAKSSDLLEDDHPHSLKGRPEDISPSNFQTRDDDCTGQEGVSQPAVVPEKSSNVLEDDPHYLEGRPEDISPSDYQTRDDDSQPAVVPEKSSNVLEEDPHSLKGRPEDISPSNYPTRDADFTGQEGVSQPAAMSGTSSDVLEDDLHSLKGRPEDISPSNYQTKVVDSMDQEAVSQPAVMSGISSDVLEEDPHSLKGRPEDISPSNYQTKVVDPSGQGGGKEADVDSLAQGLKNVSVGDESKSYPGGEQPRSYTEDISPSNFQAKDADSTGQPRVLQPAVLPATSSDGLEEDPHSLKDIPPSNYQAKVVDPTGQGGKEADVDSLTQGLKKASVDSESKSLAQEEQTYSDESKSLPGQEQPLSYGGSHDQLAQQSTPTEESLLPQSHSVPEDEPKHPESMPHEAVDPTVQGGKAADVDSPTQGLKNGSLSNEAMPAAQQADESKPLAGEEQPRSYTGSHDQFAPTEESLLPQSHPMPEDAADKEASAKNVEASSNQTQEPSDVNTQQKKPITETAAEYKNMVAEKLTPVYERVSGAGTTVMSKVRGSGTEEKPPQGGGDEAPKGWSDKFKPGEGDKALSKAIAEKLQMTRKPADESEASYESKTTNGSSPGVMSSLKGVVGSWLGKGNGTKSAATTPPGSQETVAREEANVEQRVEQ